MSPDARKPPLAPPRAVKPTEPVAPPTVGLTRARVVERKHRTGRHRRFALPALLLPLACGLGPPDVPVVNGCEVAAYVDRAEPSADRRVGFGTALGSGAVAYEPRCLRIAPGQTVTFVGNFSTHPLSPGAPRSDAGTSLSPITRQETGMADYAVTFEREGLYPYYCELHEPTMAGAVWVR